MAYAEVSAANVADMAPIKLELGYRIYNGEAYTKVSYKMVEQIARRVAKTVHLY